MFKKILEGIIPTLLIGVGWFSWEVDSESEVYVQEVYSSVFCRSHVWRREETRTGQREVSCGSVTTKDSADPTRSSGVRMTLPSCLKLGQGIWAFQTFH